MKCWGTETKEAPRASRISTMRAGEAVDLVYDDHVDLAAPEIVEQALQAGPLHRSAGEAAIVIGGVNQPPTLVGLAGDVGGAGVALGVERVEGLLQALLGRLPGIDGATDQRRLLHGLVFRLADAFRPKKVGPDLRVPVMARATSERLANRVPWCSKPSAVPRT